MAQDTLVDKFAGIEGIGKRPVVAIDATCQTELRRANTRGKLNTTLSSRPKMITRDITLTLGVRTKSPKN